MYRTRQQFPSFMGVYIPPCSNVEGSTADIIRIDGETCAFVPSNNPECDRCCLARDACKQTCLFFRNGGFFIDKLLLSSKDKEDGNESE